MLESASSSLNAKNARVREFIVEFHDGHASLVVHPLPRNEAPRPKRPLVQPQIRL